MKKKKFIRVVEETRYVVSRRFYYVSFLLGIIPLLFGGYILESIHGVWLRVIALLGIMVCFIPILFIMFFGVVEGEETEVRVLQEAGS